MDIAWKGLVGGLMTALIAWLSKRGSVLPGILPLFPTITLISFYLVGLQGQPDTFQRTCIAALKTVPAYLAFVIVAWLSSRRVDFRVSLGLGLAAWLVVVLVIFLGLRRG